MTPKQAVQILSALAERAPIQGLQEARPVAQALDTLSKLAEAAEEATVPKKESA